jgi:hypothetical protein
MPEHLATLPRRLSWRRQIGIAGKLHETEWLLPGRQAERYQHPDYLRVRLTNLGIDCPAQRRVALLQLASRFLRLFMQMSSTSPHRQQPKWVDWAGWNWTN